MLSRLKDKPDRLTVNLPEGKRDMYISATHEFIAEHEQCDGQRSQRIRRVELK